MTTENTILRDATINKPSKIIPLCPRCGGCGTVYRPVVGPNNMRMGGYYLWENARGYGLHRDTICGPVQCEGYECAQCDEQGRDRWSGGKVMHFPAAWSDERCEAWSAAKAASAAKGAATRAANRTADRKATLEGFIPGVWECDHAIVQDISGRYLETGNITERQQNFIAKLVQEELDGTRERREAQEAADKASGKVKPVPTEEGRLAITGTIVSVKRKGNAREGYEYKLMVQADAGYRLYGNAMQAIINEARKHADFSFDEHLTTNDFASLKGQRISFTARLKPSTKDAYFGFISRPASLRFGEAAAQPEKAPKKTTKKTTKKTAPKATKKAPTTGLTVVKLVCNGYSTERGVTKAVYRVTRHADNSEFVVKHVARAESCVTDWTVQALNSDTTLHTGPRRKGALDAISAGC